MQLIRQWLQFIRIKNLLLVGLTQWMLYGLWVRVVYASAVPTPYPLAPWQVLLLIHISMLIAAAGNVINDVYDYSIDLVNKPEKVFIRRIVSFKQARLLYFGLNALALALAIVLIAPMPRPLDAWMGTGFLFIIGLLWLYARYLKRTILLGNMAISLLCALTPLYVVFPTYLTPPISILRLDAYYWWIAVSGAYLFFAFYTTLIREIIKDIEDLQGDTLLHGRTLPVAFGAQRAKYFVRLLTLMLIVAIIGCLYLLSLTHSWWSMAYIAIAILLPLVRLWWGLHHAIQKADFTALSYQMKWVMLWGLVLLMVLYYDYQGLY